LVRSVSPAVLIPASSVIREGTSSYVYVQRKQNEFEKRTVALGPTEEDQIEVQSGVKAGEVIVSEGALLLRAAGSPGGQ
jgi:cobalt-zinc-cadmium efflux system membrane fusion protein